MAIEGLSFGGNRIDGADDDVFAIGLMEEAIARLRMGQPKAAMERLQAAADDIASRHHEYPLDFEH